MDSVSGYFICRPSVPQPMYLINDCVLSINDCDSCLAKTNVIDGKMEMQGQHGDLTISLVDHDPLIFRYDLSFIAKRKFDKYKVKYHKAKVKEALGG